MIRAYLLEGLKLFTLLALLAGIYYVFLLAAHHNMIPTI